MTELRIEVERIVREVLAQVLGGSAPPSACTCAAAVAPAAPSLPQVEKPQRLPRAEELSLSNRVITLADLTLADWEGRWAAVRRVVVPPKAIVTPAVRDELRRRGVALSFARPEAAASEAMSRLAAVVHAKCCPALLPVSAAEGFAVEVIASDCIFESVDRLAAEIAAPGVAGLLLTRHVAAGLCLANRHSGVRAVSGGDAASVARGAKAVGANLLIVDAAELNIFRLKRLLVEFGRAPRECPKVFAARLN